MLYKFVQPKKRVFSRESSVDSLAYTPLHIQIQRMLDSGVSLVEYRRRLNAGSLYSQEDVSGDDPETPPFPVYKPDMAEAQRVLENFEEKFSKKDVVEQEVVVDNKDGGSPEQGAGSAD